jgi:hypothetical protein
VDAMDGWHRGERVVGRWAVDEEFVRLGWAERPSELVLTEHAVYLCAANGGGSFSVALLDVVEVIVDGSAVSLRQKTGRLIDFAGGSVNWDGRHGPVLCADDAEAKLLADHIRAAAQRVRVAGSESSPRRRRWDKASR